MTASVSGRLAGTVRLAQWRRDLQSAQIGRRLPGKQRIVVVGGLRPWETLEQPSEASVRIGAVGLAGLDERSRSRRRRCPRTAIHGAQRRVGESRFRMVVADRPVAVFVAGELRPLRAQIGQSLAEQAFFGTTPGDCSHITAWIASSTRALNRRRNRCRRCASHLTTCLGSEQLSDQLDEARRKQIGGSGSLR